MRFDGDSLLLELRRLGKLAPGMTDEAEACDRGIVVRGKFERMHEEGLGFLEKPSLEQR